MPGESMSMTNSLSPWCFFSSSEVRARMYIAVALCAWVVQILWPLRIHPPSVGTARVRTLARSEPDSGSLIPSPMIARPATMSGRIAALSSGVPARSTAGPICRSAIQCAVTGAPTRSISSVSANRSVFGRPSPPCSTGHVMPSSPASPSAREKSRSTERSQQSTVGVNRPADSQSSSRVRMRVRISVELIAGLLSVPRSAGRASP